MSRAAAPPVGAAQTDEIYEECARQLAAWRVRFRGRPDRERQRLWLLALEREQVVSIAYRESAIADRIARMPLPEAVRDLIRHAMVWVWKDEEMHTSYIRGVVLHRGGRRLQAIAYGEQIVGAVSGWAAAVRQHTQFRDAPVSVAMASALALGGRVSGKLTKALRSALEYGPFREFCAFNIELERSAELCWARLVELAEGDAQREEFAQVRDDEANHGRIFQIFGAALGEDDRLRAGVTPEDLVEQVRAVGEWFLPRRHRAAGPKPRAFGTGGPVWCRQGEPGTDKRQALRDVLTEAGLPEVIAERREAKGGSGLNVAVKTAFMLGYNRRDRSNVIDVDLVDELARVLHEHGCHDVAVLEAPTVYDRFYGHRSVEEVARYFGFDSPEYRIVDTSAEQKPFEYARGMAQSTISRTWSSADVRLVFSKLRTNPSELAHLSLSSLEGLGERQDRILFPNREVHYRAAMMMVIDAFEPDFAVVDAYEQAADGPFGVMGCRKPASPLRMYAGRDALAVDSVVLRDTGLPDPFLSPMLRSALYWFGAPGEPEVVHGDVGPIPGFRNPYHNGVSTMLSMAAYPVYVYGSGGGELFVPEMDEAAFPPLTKPSAPVRLVRRTAQLAFGLRPPG
ncbi:MAG: DUF362 domain-containing protein [Actinomycetota bacterium]|nr:DUF362 domain-containing protein [Actinomycetota bacterium]